MADEAMNDTNTSPQSSGSKWTGKERPSRDDLVAAIRTVVSLASCWLDRANAIRGTDDQLHDALVRFVDSMRQVNLDQRVHVRRVLATQLRDELALAAELEPASIVVIHATKPVVEAQRIIQSDKSTAQECERAERELKVALPKLKAAETKLERLAARRYRATIAGNELTKRATKAIALPRMLSPTWRVSCPLPRVDQVDGEFGVPDPLADAVRTGVWRVSWLADHEPRTLAVEVAKALAAKIREKPGKQGFMTSAATVALEICGFTPEIRKPSTERGRKKRKLLGRDDSELEKVCEAKIRDWLKAARHPDGPKVAPDQVDEGQFFCARGHNANGGPTAAGPVAGRSLAVAELLAEVCNDAELAPAIAKTGLRQTVPLWPTAARGLSSAIGVVAAKRRRASS